MQRVRIGLMGLAVVFLLVLLAAAFFGMAGSGPDVARPGTQANADGGPANAVEADPKEPLAELGVAPGGAGEAENGTEAPIANGI